MKAFYHLVEYPLNFKNLSRETEGDASNSSVSHFIPLSRVFEIILYPFFFKYFEKIYFDDDEFPNKTILKI